MLVPDKMCHLTIVGSKDHMERVIAVLHDLGSLHIDDYSGGDEGLRMGAPLPEAGGISKKLLLLRSMSSKIGLTEGESPELVRESEVKAHLEKVLFDLEMNIGGKEESKAKAEALLKVLTEKRASLANFIELGLPLEYFSGYSSVAVFTGRLGEGASFSTVSDAIKSVTPDAEIFQGKADQSAIAVFAPFDLREKVQQALMDAKFEEARVPEGSGSPEAHDEQLKKQEYKVKTQLKNIKGDIEKLRKEHAKSILAAEEYLTIQVTRAEAPLRFATTENAFIIRGWVREEELDVVYNELMELTDDSLYIEHTLEPRRIAHREGHEGGKEEHGAAHKEEPIQHAKDGENGQSGHSTLGGAQEEMAAHAKEASETPTSLKNPAASTPFEMLINLFSLPKYREIDPTSILFFTFPLFFGLMISDFGYGLVVLGFAMYLKKNKIMGIGGEEISKVLFWCSIYTMVFGLFMFGEAFGIHFAKPLLMSEAPADTWYSMLGFGTPGTMYLGPIPLGVYSKIHNVKQMLALSLIIGLAHMTLGLLAGLINEYMSHGVKRGLFAKVAWILILIGFFMLVFPLFTPNFYDKLGPLSVLGSAVLGIPSAIVVCLVGAVLLIVAEGAAIVEFFGVLGNLLSYTRLCAVGLSKAGFAAAINAIAIPSLLAPDMGTKAGGFLIMFMGHTLIILLGMIASGLHALRLQFVEFFTKFYTGGGVRFKPFGFIRKHTEV